MIDCYLRAKITKKNSFSQNEQKGGQNANVEKTKPIKQTEYQFFANIYCNRLRYRLQKTGSGQMQ